MPPSHTAQGLRQCGGSIACDVAPWGQEDAWPQLGVPRAPVRGPERALLGPRAQAGTWGPPNPNRAWGDLGARGQPWAQPATLCHPARQQGGDGGQSVPPSTAAPWVQGRGCPLASRPGGTPGPQGQTLPCAFGEGGCQARGVLREHPAATGCQVPSQPSCEAAGGGFRDWRLSSEHQFCNGGGWSGGTDGCKRKQKEEELLAGK